MITFQRKTVIGLIYFKASDGTRRFLVVKNFRNKYIFVGGGIKKNEPLDKAILREIKEETGIEENQISSTTPVSKILDFESQLLFLKIKTEQNFFFIKLKEQPKSLKLNWELKEYFWLSDKEALEKLSYDNLKEIFQYILNNYV